MQRVQICLNGRSCAALDACISPCHDVTIQNPPNALINIQSVVLQLRQPGGTFLRFSPKNCTLYASSILGSVSNAMVRVSHVMLNASCVHTRILWPTSNVEMDVIGESLMPPLVAMTSCNLQQEAWRGTYARLNAFDKCEQLPHPVGPGFYRQLRGPVERKLPRTYSANA